ncbi:hypothetical protein AVEN_85812-1 [Araneus ventricosus]|uniref:Uncharacterized protein n=1 Tax=Araneus ventricosus TaxID=182803 RepID=A0A4Y2CET8_ARAVE|nr:hypothetical protein AVEN_85812-1 [Araneus ventricosus]
MPRRHRTKLPLRERVENVCGQFGSQERSHPIPQKPLNKYIFDNITTGPTYPNSQQATVYPIPLVPWRRKILKISRLAQRAPMPNLPRSTQSPSELWRRKYLKISRLALGAPNLNLPRSTLFSNLCRSKVLKV